MKRLWFFLKQERLWTFLCLVIMLMSSAFTIIQAGFIANIISFTVNLDQAKDLPQMTEGGYLFDKVIKVFRLIIDGDNLGATQYILSNKGYLFYTILTIISILFITITQMLFFLRDFNNQYFTFRISARIRKKFYNQALNYDFLYLRNRQSGDLISRILNDIKIVEGDIYPFLESLVYGPIILTFGLVTMLLINTQFTLILIIGFIVLGIAIFFISSFFKKLVKLTQEKLSDITVHIKSSLENIDVIKIFNRQDYERHRFSETIHHHLSLMKRSVFIHFLNRPISELFITTGGLLILFYSSRLIMEEQITITQLFSFFSILIYVVPYVQRINNGFFLKQRIDVAMERLFDSSDTLHFEKTEGKLLDVILNEKGYPPFEGNIEFRGISFNYLAEKPALKDISFTTKRGEFVAIVGESGSGKTTLLNMIPLLIIPQQGEIFYDGISFRELSLAGVRKHISFVPQESALFPISIMDNILYGNPNADKKMVEKAARLANIHDVIKALPQGYDTLVGDQGSKLSVGQKQRLAIARALIKSPQILILDEATSSLDSVSENLIQKSINKISHNKTIFAIAHRLTTILDADKILVIDEGRIMGIGTHKELLAQNSIYQKLYRNQFQQLD